MSQTDQKMLQNGLVGVAIPAVGQVGSRRTINPGLVDSQLGVLNPDFVILKPSHQCEVVSYNGDGTFDIQNKCDFEIPASTLEWIAVMEFSYINPENQDPVLLAPQSGSGLANLCDAEGEDIYWKQNAYLCIQEDSVIDLASESGWGVLYEVDTDTPAAPLSVTLQTPATDGIIIHIKRHGPDIVTIDTEGAEQIDGQNSIVLNSDDDSLTLQWVASPCVGNPEWKII